MDVMVFYMDPSGKRRAWAKGPAEEQDTVRASARKRLDAWIEQQNETLGEEEWSPDDFHEFVADVRETS